MPKTISADLQAHLAQPVTTVCVCWQLSLRNGTNLYLTDLDVDLTINGTTYLSQPGFQKTASEAKVDMSVDNLEIQGVLDSDFITIDDLRGGLYDFATVYTFLVNYADLTQGMLKLRKGTLGEIQCLPSGAFTTELRGMVQRLHQTVGEVYSVDCRAILGDARCKIPILPSLVARNQACVLAENGNYPTNVVAVVNAELPGWQQYGGVQFVCTTAGTTSAEPVTYDATLGSFTTDGTAVFQCTEGYTRGGLVTSVTDQATFLASFPNPDPNAARDSWYVYGVLTWESGQNNGTSIEIKQWESSISTLQTWLPQLFPIAVGDTFRVSVGCNNQLTTCLSKFNNINNFRGEPAVPGQDNLTYYPDAH